MAGCSPRDIVHSYLPALLAPEPVILDRPRNGSFAWTQKRRVRKAFSPVTKQRKPAPAWLAISADLSTGKRQATPAKHDCRTAHFSASAASTNWGVPLPFYTLPLASCAAAHHKVWTRRPTWSLPAWKPEQGQHRRIPGRRSRRRAVLQGQRHSGRVV
jgi:hypothetical protein